VKSTLNQNAALIEFLTEFAKYMITSGVSLADFQSAATTAFIQAAMGRARLRNSRVNQSALAAITGLNRTQIRTLMHEWEEGPPLQPSRLIEVLNVWQSDSQFGCGRDSEFRLPIRGGEKSFSSLVRKCCGDVSYKALLTELKGLGYVQIRGTDVLLTPRGRERLEPLEIRRLASGLAFALRNESSAKMDMSVFTAEAIYGTPSPKSRLLIKKRLLQSTKALAAHIKAAGEAEATKAPKGSRRKSRSSVFVLTVDPIE
jgi:hypothetical protein